MNKQYPVTILMLALTPMLFLSCGSSSGGGGGQSAGACSLKYSDPSEPIEVTAGKIFVISLDSNATTGYSWRIYENYPEGIVELVDHIYRPGETSRIGAGGTEFWAFRALKTGETKITMEYVRPWEEGAKPAEQKTFEVSVL
jgi:inhibitor of cysteine peptidase